VVSADRARPSYHGSCHHGRCAHCQRPWCVVEGSNIQDSDHGSMFPVCTECYPTLTTAQLEVYIARLTASWMLSARTPADVEQIDGYRLWAIAWVRGDKAGS